MTLQIVPVSPVLGAEVIGADLTSLNDSTFAQISAALADHQVLFFRDQEELPADDEKMQHRPAAVKAADLVRGEFFRQPPPQGSAG